jgi:hypothetical protein
LPITKVEFVRISLVDPYLKTTRAKAHLDALRSDLDAFRESKPYSFTFDVDADRSLYVVKVELKDPPSHLALIVGDLFYCLRSSLDQLVYALAKLTTALPKGTQFPIIDEFNKDNMQRFNRQTSGVPSEAREIIKSLQPYHGSNETAIRSHLLWRLNAICNLDKHRRIPIHSSRIDLSFPNLPKSIEASLKFGPDTICVPLRYKNQMTVDPKVSFRLVFGDLNSGIECDVDGIAGIYHFVSDSVIPRFARFFTP